MMNLIFSGLRRPLPESFQGMKYLYSIINLTKFAKVYFMASKSQASEMLDEFLFFFAKGVNPTKYVVIMRWNTRQNASTIFA